MDKTGWEWRDRLATPGAPMAATLADVSQEVVLDALADSVKARAAARRELSGRRRLAAGRRSAGAREG